MGPIENLMDQLINAVFYACVVFLEGLAQLTGLTYNQVNVLIFCILWPILTVYLFMKVTKQRIKIKELQFKLSTTQQSNAK